MKRLIAGILVLCMLFSFVGCASSSLVDINGTTAESDTTEAEQTSTKEEGPITLPKGFSVGFGRADISPTQAVLTYEGAVTCNVHDPLFITCVAVADGEEVALFYSLDLRQSWSNIVEKSMSIVIEKYGHLGLDESSMFFTATHNHSSPDAGTPSAKGMKQWYKIYYPSLEKATEEALRDLTQAEAYVGKSNTKDISFVRRLIHADGKVTTITKDAVGYESQPDTELRTIRFAREGKKDVLMVNYQTHYGVATSLFGKDAVSADFIHDFRKAAEEELDVLFSYYQGAAGCTVFHAIKGDRVYPTYVDAIPAFMTTVREALAGEEKAQTGKIQKEMNYYEGKIHKSDEATVALAASIYYEKDQTKKNALLAAQDVFPNAKAAEACVYRNLNTSVGETQKMHFSAISFGEIAFSGAPYEMFHQNGIQIREMSPFKMTFVCAYTNGSHSYVPARECTTLGSSYNVKDCYENYVTRFVEGSGEEFRDELVRLLNLCKAEG